MATVSKRKVITFGNGLGITIPAGWARYFNLQAGDTLEVIEDNVLTIRPLKKVKKGNQTVKYEWRDGTD